VSINPVITTTNKPKFSYTKPEVVTRCLQQLLASGSHHICSENFYQYPLVIKITVITCIASFNIFLYCPHIKFMCFFYSCHKRRLSFPYTGCSTRYQIRHFFNNSNTNEDIATKFEQKYVCCVKNKEECVCSVCLFRCNIFIDVIIIKEMPGSVASGTPCIYIYIYQYVNICLRNHLLNIRMKLITYDLVGNLLCFC
jgi:hypothetical protein